MPSLRAPCRRPCPAIIPPCSSIRIGLVKPNSRIDAAICATWLSECVRLLRAKGIRSASGLYSTFIVPFNFASAVILSQPQNKKRPQPFLVQAQKSNGVFLTHPAFSVKPHRAHRPRHLVEACKALSARIERAATTPGRSGDPANLQALQIRAGPATAVHSPGSCQCKAG